MKVLLVNPPEDNTIAEYTNGKESEFMPIRKLGSYPPLGLIYVAGYLDTYSNHQIRVVDCIGEHLSHEAFGNVVKEFQPDVVGITSFTIALVDSVYVAQTVKKHCPDAHVCLGGHHPIAYPFESVQLKEFDSVVVGEGEIAFHELCQAIEATRGQPENFTKAIENIQGVYNLEKMQKHAKNPVKNDKRFLATVTAPPAYVEDLDKLPFPGRKFLSHVKHINPTGTGRKLATLVTSRGCPYSCTFCDVPYKRYRERSYSNVLDEVEECLAQGYDEFHFYDDLFNIKAEKVIKFCDEIEKRKIKFKWDFRGRVNACTKETLIRAKQAGCWGLSLGVETGNDEGLKLLKKGNTTAKTRQVFKWTRELGLKTTADFMIGFPFEKTKDDIRKNIDYLIELDPDYCLIAILMLLPNTEIWRDAVKKGEAEKDAWVKFALDPVGQKEIFKMEYWTEHLTPDDLVDMRIESYRRFYLRPKYILRSAIGLRSLQEFKNKVYGFFTMLERPNKLATDI